MTPSMIEFICSQSIGFQNMNDNVSSEHLAHLERELERALKQMRRVYTGRDPIESLGSALDTVIEVRNRLHQLLHPAKVEDRGPDSHVVPFRRH